MWHGHFQRIEEGCPPKQASGNVWQPEERGKRRAMSKTGVKLAAVDGWLDRQEWKQMLGTGASTQCTVTVCPLKLAGSMYFVGSRLLILNPCSS